MVRSWLPAVMLAAIACGPRVDPRSPFDEDDPRSGEAAAAAEPAKPTEAPAPVVVAAVIVPDAPRGPGVREGTIARANLVAVLDEHPSQVLKGFEVAAELRRGKFEGWRLVRLLSSGARFRGLDLAPGDVLLSINGRALVTPYDLDALWSELYNADVIAAQVRRGAGVFTLRFTVSPRGSAGPVTEPDAMSPPPSRP